MSTVALPRAAATRRPHEGREFGLVTLLGAAFSFETVFVLFLFSGQYKADPRFEWLRVDATILFGLLNVAQGAVLLFDKRFKPNLAGIPVVLAGALFAAYTALSLTWAPGEVYANYKAAYVATINLWCLGAGAVVVASSRQRLTRFLAVQLIFSAWIALECGLFYAHNAQFGRVMQIHAMAGESAYIGLGRVVTWGAVICGCFWLFGLPQGWRGWRSPNVTLLGLVGFTGISAMIGARGPILGAALAVLVAAILYTEGRSLKERMRWATHLVTLSVAAVVAVIAHKAWTGEFPLLVKRFLAFSQESQYYDQSGSSYMRLELYWEAILAWWERPWLGQGVGGFSVFWSNVDERLFCHNLVLEILAELGLVGLCLATLVVLTALRIDAHRWRQTPAVLKGVVFALAASAFLNTMTSGDMPDNRYFFFAVGLLAIRAPEAPRRTAAPALRLRGVTARQSRSPVGNESAVALRGRSPRG